MNPYLPLILLAGAAVALGGCATLQRGPVGNSAVPQPAKPVDLSRYAGRWYEIGRYEAGFQRGCEGVTATPRARMALLTSLTPVGRAG